MVQYLYVNGAEHGSGNSIIIRGMMGYYSGHTGKVGLFRPATTGDTA